MSVPLKIVIPTAGWATRMRPQTWSKPKPLVSVAGRAVLDHLLDSFRSVPDPGGCEYVLILGPHLGETQIPAYMQENHPGMKVHYVLQPEMQGQSQALHLARAHLTGPVLMCFSDTLIETDFSLLAGPLQEGLAWVKPVPDPRRFGVAEVGPDGRVRTLVEKPTSLENNLVVVGCYYFPDGQALVQAIEEQMRRGDRRKGEFFLADAINILIEGGLAMRTRLVETWLDTGTIEATLATNRYLLDKLPPPGQARPGVQVRPPVFIDPSAQVHDSIIGPYASIGPGCRIREARVEDSILERGVVLERMALVGSFVGREAQLRGRSAGGDAVQMNVGDNSTVLAE